MVSVLPKPDLLNTMQISILYHLHNWSYHFMKMHKPLDTYNAIWLSVPAYPNLTRKYKFLEKVCQWNGKEIKQMRWYLLDL